MIIPGSPEYLQLFDGFQRSAYRLETLQYYQADNEAGPLRAFIAGQPRPELPGKDRWVSRIRDARTAGKTMSRVRVVAEPLSDYLRYELSWSYPANVAAGEDIRIMGQDAAEMLGLPEQDHWLFDSEVLVWFHYSSAGRLVGAEVGQDPDMILMATRWSANALDAAIRYSEYMDGHAQMVQRAS